jgi:hypothetical protein
MPEEVEGQDEEYVLERTTPALDALQDQKSRLVELQVLESEELDEDRAAPRVGLPPVAELATRDKTDTNRGLMEEPKGMVRQRALMAAPERSAGLGGGARGQPADSPAKAKKETLDLASSTPFAHAAGKPAGKPAASPALKRGQLAVGEDMATQDLAGSQSYEFKPLVRQYATWRSTQIEPDRTETIYWNPLLLVDENGPVTIRFRLSDAETTYRLLINGHGDGRLGTYRDTITAAPGADGQAGDRKLESTQ